MTTNLNVALNIFFQFTIETRVAAEVGSGDDTAGLEAPPVGVPGGSTSGSSGSSSSSGSGSSGSGSRGGTKVVKTKVLVQKYAPDSSLVHVSCE